MLHWIVRCVLLFMKLVSANKTTAVVSDSEVIQAVKAYRGVNMSFPVVDFYMSLYSNKTQQASQYFNVIENARQFAMHGGVSLTYATFPSTTTKRTSTTTLIYDWMELYGLDVEALEARLAELRREKQKWLELRSRPYQSANEQPLVELLLAQQENKTIEYDKLNVLLAVTNAYSNVYDSFKLRYNQGPLENLGRILEQNIRETAATTTIKPELLISEIFVNVNESIPRRRDLLENTKNKNNSMEKIQRDINKNMEGIQLENSKNNTNQIENLELEKDQRQNIEKGSILMENSNEKSGEATNRSKIVQMFHPILKMFRKLNIIKKLSQSETMMRTKKPRVSIKETMKSKLFKKIYRFFNDLQKIKKFVNKTVKVNDTVISNFKNNRVVKWILKNSSGSSLQGSVNRKVRSVDNEKCLSNQTSKGVFDKILNFFRSNKNVEHTKPVEDPLTKSPKETSDMRQRKLNQTSFTLFKWLDFLKVKKRSTSSSCTMFTQSLGPTDRLKSFSASMIFRSMVTNEHDNTTVAGTYKVEDARLSLFEDVEMFFQEICNTTEPIPMTDVKSFVGGISTKAGQKWFEALRDYNNESNSADLTDSWASKESSGEQTTTHLHQGDLWKFFEKSKASVTKAQALISKPFVSTLCNGNIFPQTNPDKVRSKICEKRVTSKCKYQISISSLRGRNQDVQSKPHKLFHCTHSRFTTSPRREVTTPGGIRALWKFYHKSLQSVTNASISSTLEPRTYFRTQSAVFTYKKKPRTTQVTQMKETAYIITEDPKKTFNINGTLDYDDFLAFVRASVSPDMAAFFTDTILSTSPRVTIKKSLLDMIKNIFRGGRAADPGTKRKTASEEDLEHYKFLSERFHAKGNISQQDFEKRKMGNIQLRFDYPDACMGK